MVCMAKVKCAVPLVSSIESLQAISKAAREFPSLTTEQRQEWEKKAYAYDLMGTIIE